MKTMDELYKYCKKLQIFIFSKKSKKIRNLNSERKCTGTPPFIHATHNSGMVH